MSAAPQLFPIEPFGADLTIREAASALGVSESTLRRTIKQAAGDGGSNTYARCEYRGRTFAATRQGDRQPWTVVFAELAGESGDVSRAAVARVDGRIAELRVAMLPVAQEPPLEHTPERRWWKFWAKR